MDERTLQGLELTAVQGGTRLRLRVKPGAGRDGIVGVHGGALKIGVQAPPERGKANRAVIGLLAEELGVPRSAVEIVGGETSQDKVARIALTPEDLRKRLGSPPELSV